MTHAEPTTALEPRQRLLIGGVALAIPLALLALTRLPLGLDQSRIVFGAAIVDILVFGGGAVWLVARRQGGFGALGVEWRRVARGVFVALALAGLVARLSGVALAGWLLAPLVLAEAVVGLTVLRAVALGYRTGEGPRWARLEAALARRLGPLLAGAAVGEIRLVGAAARSVTRRPLPRTADEAHHPGAGATWRTVVFALILVTFAEALVLHLLLAKGFDITHPAAHGALSALHLYGIIWLLGDLRLMAESAHRVDADGLTIALGLRWRGFVPWSAVQRITPGEVAEPDRLIGEKRPPHVLAVTPAETPIITLHLRAPVELGTYFGITRSGTEIALYVDDPARFVAAAEPHLPCHE